MFLILISLSKGTHRFQLLSDVSCQITVGGLSTFAIKRMLLIGNTPQTVAKLTIWLFPEPSPHFFCISITPKFHKFQPPDLDWDLL